MIALLAFGCCLAVELFKLTGIPAEHQHLLLVRWFLGMTFSVVNLGYYFIGVVLIAFADGATRGAKQTERARSEFTLVKHDAATHATPSNRVSNSAERGR